MASEAGVPLSFRCSSWQIGMKGKAGDGGKSKGGDGRGGNGREEEGCGGEGSEGESEIIVVDLSDGEDLHAGPRAITSSLTAAFSIRTVWESASHGWQTD